MYFDNIHPKSFQIWCYLYLQPHILFLLNLRTLKLQFVLTHPYLWEWVHLFECEHPIKNQTIKEN